MNPDKPAHLHRTPRIKPFAEIAMPAYVEAKPLDLRKLYGSVFAKLDEVREIKSFMPIIETAK